MSSSASAASSQAATNNLEAFWMPYTANRQFKQNPRMFVGAKDMHYTTADGRQVLDGTAGLWCCNAGHSRPKIVEAVQNQSLRWTMPRPFRWGILRPLNLPPASPP
jgi:beta-alanine--pyruvate transaminase